MENFFKTKVLNKDKKGISAVKPYQYQLRFRNFMRDEVFVNQTFDNQSLDSETAKQNKFAASEF